MSKKERIVFQRSDALEAIDFELTAAMDNLDETNQRIVDLLGSFEPPAPSVEPEEGAGAATATATVKAEVEPPTASELPPESDR